jgi:hypothetical protein
MIAARSGQNPKLFFRLLGGEKWARRWSLLGSIINVNEMLLDCAL